ncbi:MAG: hypothetical protein SVS85_03985, partial [Candidatus Nanohaloarchaea archaeon]|nr:hypothetical protein [Candidatus Nanohaloarchaea archaeon]
PITGDSFSIPEYDSQREMLTQFVAPFLLIALILHVGLYRALLFTLAEDPPTVNSLLVDDPYEKDRSRIRKQSLLISVVITGMLVPTPFF